jgi:hypothetical protein
LRPPSQCKKQTARAKRGEGSGAPKDASNHVRRADKRIVQIRSSAFGAERAADRAACAAHLLSGRARLPAHRCGSRAGFDTRTQLQAMLPGRSAGGRYPPARTPSSGTAPPAAAVVPQGVMPGAARERFARPRAGAASRSAIRIASGMRPSASEIRHSMYFI